VSGGWVVLQHWLRDGRPLDPPEQYGPAQQTLRRAREVREECARLWRLRDFDVRQVEHGIHAWRLWSGSTLTGYLVIEERRDKPFGRGHYWIWVQGAVVATAHTKAEAGRKLASEVQRWRSSRWPKHTALPNPSRPGGRDRQCLHYFLLDRGAYAGEAVITDTRRGGQQ
jgi:hypothetical protein